MTLEQRIEVIKKIIFDEKVTPADDRTGQTPLLDRAAFYKNRPQTDSEKIDEIQALSLLRKNFNEFDDTDFRNLFSYMEIGQLYNSVIEKSYIGYLYSLDQNVWQQHKESRAEALKRVYLIQLLLNFNEYSLSVKEIKSQSIINQYFPWTFAELVSYKDIIYGSYLITELYRKQVRYSIIYDNREIWLKKYGEHLFIIYVLPLKEFLKNEDQKDLEDFCDSHGIYQVKALSNRISLDKTQFAVDQFGRERSMAKEYAIIKDVYAKTFFLGNSSSANSTRERKGFLPNLIALIKTPAFNNPPFNPVKLPVSVSK